MKRTDRRPADKAPPAPIEPPAGNLEADGLELLPDAGKAAAGQLTAIVQARAAGIGGDYGTEGNDRRREYPGEGSIELDSDGAAVAIRERLVRHSLDAMAGRLLPKTLSALDLMLEGKHPDSRGGAQAAKLVFEALRMTGAHVLDRDRSKGADALTVAELEAEIARASSALRRKLEPSVVSTQPPSDPAGKH